jgi:molecular chaperone DnaK
MKSGNDNSRMFFGIDLGTGTTVVGFATPTTDTEIFTFPTGENYMDSAVYYEVKDGTPIAVAVGAEALHHAVENPSNTISNSKRYLGLTKTELDNETAKAKAGKPSDRGITQDMVDKSPFKIVFMDGQAKIQIKSTDGTSKYITPADVSFDILRKVHQEIEARFGINKPKCVITVPAYFNDAQRNIVKNTGVSAGFDVMRILNEPTAAAASWAEKIDSGQYLLVVDYGAGTLDCSLLEKTVIKEDDGHETTLMTVILTSGDLSIGSSDFTSLLAQYLKEQVQKLYPKDSYGNVIVMDGEKDMAIREEAERMKKELSSRSLAKLSLSKVGRGFPTGATIEVSRAKFEAIIEPVTKKFREVLQRTFAEIKSKNINAKDIRVLTTGGVSFDEYMSKTIYDVWKTIMPQVSEDQIIKNRSKNNVAEGATIIAKAIGEAELAKQGKGNPNASKSSLLIMDVTPLTLGIETKDGVMSAIVEKNTQIPVKKTNVYSTAEDNQTSVDIKLYQGESPLVRDNILLGEFKLSGIAPAPRGVPMIEVTVGVDENGITTIEAVDKASSNKRNLTITGKTNTADINRNLETIKQHEKRDKLIRENIEIKNEAERVYNYVEKQLAAESKLSQEAKDDLKVTFEEMKKEMDMKVEFENLNAERYKSLTQELTQKAAKYANQTGTENPNADQSANNSHSANNDSNN